MKLINNFFIVIWYIRYIIYPMQKSRVYVLFNIRVKFPTISYIILSQTTNTLFKVGHGANWLTYIFSVHDSGRYDVSASRRSLPAQAIAWNELETVQLRYWDRAGWFYVGEFVYLLPVSLFKLVYKNSAAVIGWICSNKYLSSVGNLYVELRLSERNNVVIKTRNVGPLRIIK